MRTFEIKAYHFERQGKQVELAIYKSRHDVDGGIDKYWQRWEQDEFRKHVQRQWYRRKLYRRLKYGDMTGKNGL